MDVHDRVQAIVFTGKQNLRFDAFEKGFEFFELRSELIADRFAFAGEFDESLDVVDLPRISDGRVRGFLRGGRVAEESDWSVAGRSKKLGLL